MKTEKTKKVTKKESKTAGASLDRKDADFTVLMLGARRTGKSSMLSSMINSMDKLCAETGFRFAASESTKIFMNTKQSQLQNIFHAFRGQEEFCTQEGIFGDISFSEATDGDISYRFVLELADTRKKKTKEDIIIDFVDPMGESLTETPETEIPEAKPNRPIGEWVAQSAVILIAIDAPALMEGITSAHDFGTFHEAVNLPDLVFEHIKNADTYMREHLKKGEQMAPKIILFVPLKCEKYYYEKSPLIGMSVLRDCIKEGYKDLFTFFENHLEYTVAITPILTLGDVVFDHYKTRTVKAANGVEREIPIVYSDDMDKPLVSLSDIPKYPMFRFRNEQPQFSPQYCEQPLLYLLAYISCITKIVEGNKKKGAFWKKAAFWTTVIVLTGGIGALSVKGAQLAIKAIASDPAMDKALKKVAEKIKLDQENGYDLVQDSLGLRKEFQIC